VRTSAADEVVAVEAQIRIQIKPLEVAIQIDLDVPHIVLGPANRAPNRAPEIAFDIDRTETGFVRTRDEDGFRRACSCSSGIDVESPNAQLRRELRSCFHMLIEKDVNIISSLFICSCVAV
jgi:hypothetical protein